MSIHPPLDSALPNKSPLLPLDIQQYKGKQNIAMLTAYDYPFAALLDAAGVDVVLVGDSLGMVVLGQKDTVGVSLADMVHHTRAVVRGVAHALVVADMPFMTYEQGPEQAMKNAAFLVQQSGVRAVKLEGGRQVVPQVQALVRAGIAVMGHIGLTPQRATTLGGFKVQGKTASAAAELVQDALALEEAGCFSIVLEAMPAPVAAKITASLRIPTIGIGAGADCDGQVLVLHDMLGLTLGHVPRFVKQYSKFTELGAQAVAQYVGEVRQGTFPAPEHGFAMAEEERAAFEGKKE